MTRVAVIADVHGNVAALQSVIDDIARRGVDLVLNLGDHASGPLWPRETIDVLMRQQSWIHIAGNCDRQMVHQPPATLGASDRFAVDRLTPRQREWLAALPPTATVAGDILLFHGTPSNDSLYLLESVGHGHARLADHSEIEQRLAGARAPVLLCGHSHVPRVVRTETSLIVNPGSVGLPAYDHDEPEPHVMETGAPDARYAVLEQSGSGWTPILVAVPYDHSRAAAQAERNGRPEWARALRTGFASH